MYLRDSVVTVSCARQPMLRVIVAMPNGASKSFDLSGTLTLEELRKAAERWFQKKILQLLRANGETLGCGTATLDAARITNGCTLTALALRVEIAATGAPFAAWRAGDDRVITWGDWQFNVVVVAPQCSTCCAAFGHQHLGGDSSRVHAELRDVRFLSSDEKAFAAVLGERSVVTWGLDADGGDSSAARHPLDGKVTHIAATRSACAALLLHGSVVTWGRFEEGGDASEMENRLQNVVEIEGNGYAFAARLVDGSVVTWGEQVAVETILVFGISFAVRRHSASNMSFVDDEVHCGAQEPAKEAIGDDQAAGVQDVEVVKQDRGILLHNFACCLIVAYSFFSRLLRSTAQRACAAKSPPPSADVLRETEVYGTLQDTRRIWHTLLRLHGRRSMLDFAMDFAPAGAHMPTHHCDASLERIIAFYEGRYFVSEQENWILLASTPFWESLLHMAILKGYEFSRRRLQHEQEVCHLRQWEVAELEGSDELTPACSGLPAHVIFEC
eukprot:s1288_g14.t1